MGRLYDAIGGALVIGGLGAALLFAPDTETLARNQFLQYARTIEGRQEITDTLKKLMESPNENAIRIRNLERVLSIALTTIISGPTQCPEYPFPGCEDIVRQTFNGYALGEIRL